MLPVINTLVLIGLLLTGAIAPPLIEKEKNSLVDVTSDGVSPAVAEETVEA
jgi:hypothetical protein